MQAYLIISRITCLFQSAKVEIVIYNRVSSAAQSLELQDAAARRYLESQNLVGNEEFIIYLSDHDVSATKLKMSQRPKLMVLIPKGLFQSTQ